MKLDGKKIAILIAPRGTEDLEFAKPRSAVEKQGARVTVISLEVGEAMTVNNDLDRGSSYPIDKTIDDVSAADFDGLVVPGGCVAPTSSAVVSRSSDSIVISSPRTRLAA